MKAADFLCYGGIGTDKGEISASLVSDFIASLPSSVEEINVRIISNGGDLFQAYAIHDLLRNSGRKIRTIAEGFVASSGTVVFMSGDEREIYENARLMFHLPFLEDPKGDFRSNDLIDMGQEMRSEEAKIKSFYQKKTSLDSATIDSLTSKDTFITADQALELKFATKIAEPLKAVAYFKPTKIKEMSNTKMSMLERINAAAKILAEGEMPPAPIKASSATADNGTIMYFDGVLAEGSSVFSDEAMTIPTADGSYILMDGSTVTVVGGVVMTIQGKASPQPSAEEEIAALKAEVAKLNTELQAKNTEKVMMDAKAGDMIEKLTAKVVAQESQLAKIKSTGDPKTSGTQFAKEKQLTSEERKAEIEKIRKGNKK